MKSSKAIGTKREKKKERKRNENHDFSGVFTRWDVLFTQGRLCGKRELLHVVPPPFFLSTNTASSVGRTCDVPRLKANVPNSLLFSFFLRSRRTNLQYIDSRLGIIARPTSTSISVLFLSSDGGQTTGRDLKMEAITSYKCHLSILGRPSATVERKEEACGFSLPARAVIGSHRLIGTVIFSTSL